MLHFSVLKRPGWDRIYRPLLRNQRRAFGCRSSAFRSQGEGVAGWFGAGWLVLRCQVSKDPSGCHVSTEGPWFQTMGWLMLVAFENILRCFLLFPRILVWVVQIQISKPSCMSIFASWVSLNFWRPKIKKSKDMSFFSAKKSTTSPARPPPTCRPRVRVPRRCYWLPQRRPTPRCCDSCWRLVLRCRPGDTSKSWPKTKRFGALAKDTL